MLSCQMKDCILGTVWNKACISQGLSMCHYCLENGSFGRTLATVLICMLSTLATLRCTLECIRAYSKYHISSSDGQELPPADTVRARPRAKRCPALEHTAARSTVMKH